MEILKKKVKEILKKMIKSYGNIEKNGKKTQKLWKY